MVSPKLGPTLLITHTKHDQVLVGYGSGGGWLTSPRAWKPPFYYNNEQTRDDPVARTTNQPVQSSQPVVVGRSVGRGIRGNQKHKYFCRELTYLHFYFIFSYAHKCALSTARHGSTRLLHLSSIYLGICCFERRAHQQVQFSVFVAIVVWSLFFRSSASRQRERWTCDFWWLLSSEESELTPTGWNSFVRFELSIRLFWSKSIKVRNPWWLVLCAKLLSDGL